MKKSAIAALGVVAFVGGLVGVFCVAWNIPLHTLDYQLAAWVALAIAFVGLGTFVKVSI